MVVLIVVDVMSGCCSGARSGSYGAMGRISSWQKVLLSAGLSWVSWVHLFMFVPSCVKGHLTICHRSEVTHVT